ncbi:MAG: polysaccharide biosynthesis protein [Deltaproteobacteria bacterium]|nr:polysaccharide biosynthesis protein [Deltaproteobacteria bacterium]
MLAPFNLHAENGWAISIQTWFYHLLRSNVSVFYFIKKALFNHRIIWIWFLNLSISAAALFVALLLRFDFDIEGRLTPERFWIPLGALLICRAIAYLAFNLNQGYWRYSSTHEAWNIFKAHFISSLGFGSAIMLLQLPGFPRSLIFIELALSLIFAAGARLGVRLFCERFLATSLRKHFGHECLVIGGGLRGHFLTSALNSGRQSPYHVAAVLDDHGASDKDSVHGVPIRGKVSDLRRVLEENPKIALVLQALDQTTPTLNEKIKNVCAEFHVPLKVFQSFEELLCRDLNQEEAPLSMDDLLSRRTEHGHQERVALALQGKRILITGAGGSIGSELVRQVLHYEPKEVTLLDKCEYNLYSIEQEVDELLHTKPGITKPIVSCCLADIVDEKRLAALFLKHKPQIIFHAAAYKHVPLLEENAYEAFRNNVWGTLQLLRAAKLVRSERFVFVSTDKAVAPSNVMGATKRICELLLQQVNSPGSAGTFMRNPDHHLETAVVRFGNVINSAGSVLPLFNKQILAGKPITVTHQDVERYFMSIKEAANLILVAGTLGAHGEVFLLDMGKPIKIIKVAEKLRAIHGRRDIPIKITGLRPGEKLTEELYSSFEERLNTSFEKVFMVRSRLQPSLCAFTWARYLKEELDNLSNEKIASIVLAFASGGDLKTAEDWIVKPQKRLQQAQNA